MQRVRADLYYLNFKLGLEEFLPPFIILFFTLLQLLPCLSSKVCLSQRETGFDHNRYSTAADSEGYIEAWCESFGLCLMMVGRLRSESLSFVFFFSCRHCFGFTVKGKPSKDKSYHRSPLIFAVLAIGLNGRIYAALTM